MKLSEFKGDEALEVLADLIEPVAEICSDEEVKAFFGKEKGVKLATVAKTIIKRHKEEVKTILAVVDRKDPATYEPTVFELPMKLLELLNDEDMKSVFFSQGTKKGATASTSASENIAE